MMQNLEILNESKVQPQSEIGKRKTNLNRQIWVDFSGGMQVSRDNKMR